MRNKKARQSWLTSLLFFVCWLSLSLFFGMRHNDLLHDIRGYIRIIENSEDSEIDCADFFMESSYQNAKGESCTCYLISKLACELVASKLGGEREILFTAQYLAKFNAAENSEHTSTTRALQAPRLGEYNSTARIVVRALNNAGATSEQIIGFLRGLYEPLGFTVTHDCAKTVAEEAPLWYTAKEIAQINGVYSLTGKPHSQAVAAILNENLYIGDSHKSTLMLDCGDCLGVSVRYDDYALVAVEDWIIENGCPSEIYGNGRTYHVLYDFQMK